MTIFFIAIVILIALYCGAQREYQKSDILIDCVNSEIHSCDNYTEQGKEECFNASVKRCYDMFQTVNGYVEF